MSVYTWADLAKEFLAAAIDDEELRRALPVGFASRGDSKQVLREKLLESVDKLRARVDADTLIDSFTARIRASRFC